ncbi:hypothetical protein AB0O28_16145 [Microbispora sp. NPDC088329]|uniref:hypothetical protein n=1 Tax=unclassified Microbispora TaxID=2614687 RepID=UPI00343042DA
MTAPGNDNEFLHELEIDIEAEVIRVESSHPEEGVGLPVTDWLFDPTDVEREAIGLRGLLDAVEVLEDGPRSGDPAQ